MKTQMVLLLALSALALTARAETFETSSNKLVFRGSSQSEAVSSCQSDRSTNDFDCEQNAQRSDDDRRPGQGPGEQGPGQNGPGQGQGGYQPQPPNQGPGHGPGGPGTNQGGPHGGGYPGQGGQQGGYPGQGQGGQQGGWPGQNQGGGYGHQPQPPPPQPPQHSLPNGSYERSCRNAEMNGSYLAADCKNFRGRYVYSQLDLNRCQAGSDIGNNNGQLDCAPR